MLPNCQMSGIFDFRSQVCCIYTFEISNSTQSMQAHELTDAETPGLYAKEDAQYYYESDNKFLENIQCIYEKKISTMKSLFEECDISDELCQEIAQSAQVHQEANIFNSNSMRNYQANGKDKPRFCTCGCKRAMGEKFSVFADEQRLSFLGPGVILFFFFLRCLKISIAMILISFGLFSISSNMLSPEFIDFNTCLDKSSIEKYICQLNTISTFNLKESEQLKMFQLVLGAFVVIIWFLCFKFVEFLGDKKNEEIDDLLDSASDYTIRIENLPFCAVSEKQLIDYIRQLWVTREGEQFETSSEEDKLKLKSIQIIYNMSQCRELIEKIKNLSLEIMYLIRDSNRVKIAHKQTYQAKKQEFNTAMEKLEDLRYRFMEEEEFRKSISTTCALVHLHESEQQTKFLEYFEDKNSINFMAGLCSQSQKYTFKGQEVIFTRAPEPSDFNWSNCEVKFSYLRYVFIWGITIIILYSAYALVSYLKTIDYVKTSASILISVIIQVFNRIIWLSLSFLVTLEYNNTKTDSIISLMKKSIFAQVINVVVAPMLGKFLNNIALYGENSISSSALFYQFIMFFMMFIFYVANPMYYLKFIIIHLRYLRNKMIRILCQVVGEIDTIEEIRPVFNYYEGPEFPIAGAYVYMTTAIIHTFFYLHLQPILLLVLITNITGFHYIMKYLLFHRCKIPELTDIQIFRMATFAVAYAPFFYGVGSILFIVIESWEGSSLEFVSVVELIPSSLLILIWFFLHINIWEVESRINEAIFLIFRFKESFARPSQFDDNQQIAELFTKIISNAVDQGVICERKESYYQNCNVHKLFNYESELRETTNAESVERTNQLQAFCESNCKKELIEIVEFDKASRVSPQPMKKLAEVILVPAAKKKKKKESVCLDQKDRQILNLLRIIKKSNKTKEDLVTVKKKNIGMEPTINKTLSNPHPSQESQLSEFEL